jgi:hypothetical protein
VGANTWRCSQSAEEHLALQRGVRAAKEQVRGVLDQSPTPAPGCRMHDTKLIDHALQVMPPVTELEEAHNTQRIHAIGGREFEKPPRQSKLWLEGQQSTPN